MKNTTENNLLFAFGALLGTLVLLPFLLVRSAFSAIFRKLKNGKNEKRK